MLFCILFCFYQPPDFSNMSNILNKNKVLKRNRSKIALFPPYYCRKLLNTQQEKREQKEKNLNF